MNFLELQLLTPALIPAAVGLDQRALGGLWAQAAYERELESPNSDLFVLIGKTEAVEEVRGAEAVRDAKILFPSPPLPPLLGISCLWSILEEAHITVLAVDPAHQRQGLGQVLLYALLRSAQQRGLAWATLEVRASNQAALSLYRKFGFEDVGRRHQYYPDNGEDALVLWYKGLQSPDFQQQLQNWQQQIQDRLARSGWAWQGDLQVSERSRLT